MAENNGTFPELVIDMGSSGQRSGPPALSPLGQTVEGAMREILAWRPKTNDPNGFVAALKQAFSVTDVDGHTEWTWTPRSYAIQADMGAVTGAQASIYARAKAALDQSIPLLEGLFTLRSDADVEDTEGVRAVVRDRCIELVAELGTVGGPRAPRVELMFEILLGKVPANQTDPEAVDGLLGDLRDEFGLSREQINTIDEEQNLTNYLILVEHIIALYRSWEKQKHYFDNQGSDVFLGTQLVLLSRALGVVGESVQELRFIMDSVWLGAAERQTVRLASGLTIAELLDWVERFSVDEAPRVIRDGGKDGVIALQSTVKKLQQLVNEARQQALGNSNNPQAGFHSDRVRAGLDELTRHVDEVDRLTGQMRRRPAPKISLVLPNPVAPTADVRVSIEGRDFQQGAQVHLNGWGPANTTTIRGRLVNVVSSNEIRASFDLQNQGRTKWAVVVVNPDGGNGSSPMPLRVEEPPPRVIGLNPSHALAGTKLDVTIFGTDFETPATLEIDTPTWTLNVNSEDDTHLYATIIIPAQAKPGAYDVTVTNPSTGLSDTLPRGFTVDLPVSDPGTEFIVRQIQLVLEDGSIQTIDAIQRDMDIQAKAMFKEVIVHFREDIEQPSVTSNSFRVLGSDMKQVGTNVTADVKMGRVTFDAALTPDERYQIVLDITGTRGIRKLGKKRFLGPDFTFTITTPPGN